MTPVLLGLQFWAWVQVRSGFLYRVKSYQFKVVVASIYHYYAVVTSLQSLSNVLPFDNNRGCLQ